MKAVVVETKNKYAAVLKEDGTFDRIRGNYAVGETVELANAAHTQKFTIIRRAAVTAAGIAAAAVLVFGILGYRTAKAEAFSYVTVDAASSVEYTLNRMDQVIGIRALDADSAEMVRELEDADVINKPFDEVMDIAEKLMLDEAAKANMGQIPQMDISIEGGDDAATGRLQQKAQEMIERFWQEYPSVPEHETQEQKTDTGSEWESKDPEQMTFGDIPADQADEEACRVPEGEMPGGNNDAPEEEIYDERTEDAPQGGSVQQPDMPADPEYDRNAPQDIPDGHADGFGEPEIDRK